MRYGKSLRDPEVEKIVYRTKLLMVFMGFIFSVGVLLLAYDAEAKSNLSVLVVTSPSTCSVCREIAPELNKIKAVARQSGVSYREVTPSSSEDPVVTRNNVIGLPTIILQAGGKEVTRFVGYTSAESVIKYFPTKHNLERLKTTEGSAKIRPKMCEDPPTSPPAYQAPVVKYKFHNGHKHHRAHAVHKHHKHHKHHHKHHPKKHKHKHKHPHITKVSVNVTEINKITTPPQELSWYKRFWNFTVGLFHSTVYKVRSVGGYIGEHSVGTWHSAREAFHRESYE